MVTNGGAPKLDAPSLVTYKLAYYHDIVQVFYNEDPTRMKSWFFGKDKHISLIKAY